jgi:arylsulfatase A-like enzyme
MKQSLFSFLSVAILLSLGSCQQAKKRPAKPNVLFIMTDDHATQAISSYGSKINKTPNIDRIAEAGMRFKNTFCTNSICAPSRAVILTGKLSHVNGMINNSCSFDGSQQTLPKLFKTAGYETAIIGKWHLKSEPIGFDYWNILPGQGFYYNPVFNEMGQVSAREGYVTSLTTDYAIDWIENRDQDKPFYLMLHHKAPHRNWMPDTAYLNMYDDVDMPLPVNFNDNYAGREAIKNQKLSIDKDMNLIYDSKVMPEKGEKTEGWYADFMNSRFDTFTKEQKEAWDKAYGPKNEAFKKANLKGEDLLRWKYQRYIKDYLRCVASVDDNIGRILDYLKKNGLDKNTIVIYTSDQGFFLGEHGLFDKRFMYEEAYRMPFLISYPEHIEAGTVSEALSMNLDFAPTMLDLAGLPVPGDIQGKSLKPVLSNKGKLPSIWRKASYYHYFEEAEHGVERHYGIRTNRYKLIHFYYDIDSWEFYDLNQDPNEMENLYDHPEYQEIITSLHQELVRQQALYKDKPENFTKGLERETMVHLAVDAPVTYVTQPDDKYNMDMSTKLTDGFIWNFSTYSPYIPEDWLGYFDDNLDVKIKLDGQKSLQFIGLNAFQDTDRAIYFPGKVIFYAGDDENNLKKVGEKVLSDNNYNQGSKIIAVELQDISAKWVGVKAENIGTIPDNMSYGGSKPWVLVDEIIVK